MINRLLWLLALFLLAAGTFAEAQQPTSIPRIAYLTAAPLSAMADRLDAFRQGLRELGYIEGKNIVIEWRSPEGNPDRMPTLAAQLVQLKVDVIVTAGGAATGPAKQATSTIPIVMAQDENPVGNGFVASLARPGGNITGLSQLCPELRGNRVESLKEVIPRLSRVAVMETSTNTGRAQAIKEIEVAAGAMKVQLQYLDVLTAKDVEPAFRAASKGRADAVLEIVSGTIRGSQRKEIVTLAIKTRLPVMWERPEYV